MQSIVTQAMKALLFWVIELEAAIRNETFYWQMSNDW